MDSTATKDGRPRLVGWKAIGAFVGRDARTAKRWEVERGLPVHRTPGGARPTVWADPEELERWIGAGVRSPKPAAIREQGPTSRRWFIAALATGGLAVIGGGWALLRRRGPQLRDGAAAYDDDPAARELYLGAVFAANSRTPAGLSAALDDFRRLVVRRPDRAPGFAGLAETYLLLREFGVMPPADAFGRARAAALQALALDPGSAGAARSLAFVTFWRGDANDGLALFRKAVAMAPADARTHHWFATALAARGEFGPALSEIAAARKLEPQSRAVIADEALIRVSARDLPNARRMLERLTAIAPEFSAAHRYLSLVDLIEGRDAAALAEALADARNRGDTARAAMLQSLSPVLQAQGRAIMRRRWAQGLEQLYASEKASAFETAAAWSIAGDRGAALHWLDICIAEQATERVAIPGDPWIAYGLKGDPRFEALKRRV